MSTIAGSPNLPACPAVRWQMNRPVAEVDIQKPPYHFAHHGRRENVRARPHFRGVLEEVPRLFRSMAVSGISRQIPEALRDHFWIATSRSKDWRQLAGEGAANEAHVFVLDGRSRIVWRAHGAYSEARVREILSLPPP